MTYISDDLLFVKEEIRDENDLLGREHIMDNQRPLLFLEDDIKKEYNDTNKKKKSYTHFSEIVNQAFDKKNKKND